MDEYRTKIFRRILRNKIGSLPHLPTHFPSKQTTLPTPPSSSSSSAAMAYNSIYQVSTMLQFSSLQRLLVPSHLASALDCLPDRCNLKLAAQKAIDLTVNIPSTFPTPPTPRRSRHQHRRCPTTTTRRQRSRSLLRSPQEPSRATLQALAASSSGLQAPLQTCWHLSTATISIKRHRI